MFALKLASADAAAPPTRVEDLDLLVSVSGQKIDQSHVADNKTRFPVKIGPRQTKPTEDLDLPPSLTGEGIKSVLCAGRDWRRGELVHVVQNCPAETCRVRLKKKKKKQQPWSAVSVSGLLL